MEEHDLINIFDSFSAPEFKKIYIENDVKRANLKSPLTPCERKDLILNNITQQNATLNKLPISPNTLNSNLSYNNYEKSDDDISEKQHNVFLFNYTNTGRTHKIRFVAAALIFLTCTFALKLLINSDLISFKSSKSTDCRGYSSIGGDNSFTYGSKDAAGNNISDSISPGSNIPDNSISNINTDLPLPWSEYLENTIKTKLGTFPVNGSSTLKYSFSYISDVDNTLPPKTMDESYSSPLTTNDMNNINYPIKTKGLNISGTIYSYFSDLDNDKENELLVFYYKNQTISAYIYELVDGDIQFTNSIILCNMFTSDLNKECCAIYIDDKKQIITEYHSSSLLTSTAKNYIRVLSYQDNSFTLCCDTSKSTDHNVLDKYGFQYELNNDSQLFLYKPTTNSTNKTIFNAYTSCKVFDDPSSYTPLNMNLSDIQEYISNNDSDVIKEKIATFPKISAIINIL